MDRPSIVVAGATGHVGGALVRRFVAAGRPVRCLVRDPARLGDVRDDVDAVQVDLLDRERLGAALDEGSTAYFLVHALTAGDSVGEAERSLAESFADCARRACVGRIVYLGGLVDESDELSEHLASRVEVGRILRESGVQTLELRASIVIGAGSFSFELIRRLVDWLPVLALPSWTENLAQPIALDDVVSYLEAAADAEVDGSAVFEIGGADRISYRGLIEAYARASGAERLTVSLPVPDIAAAAAARAASPLTGRLPGEVQEALKLFESLRHATVVRDSSAERFGVEPMGVAEAIAAAVR
jgi:uncharacterized protein YbjT (DUF2867 family)